MTTSETRIGKAKRDMLIEGVIQDMSFKDELKLFVMGKWITIEEGVHDPETGEEVYPSLRTKRELSMGLRIGDKIRYPTAQ